MKLINSQIEQLYTFTRQHFVVYYDVQSELVDHLANDIEQIWKEQPQLPFEKARDISFKKFGVFGFMDVIEQKQKAMNKKYWKILWCFVKEWFQLPKIIITFGSIFILYTFFSSQFGEYFFYGAQGILVFYLIVKTIRLKRIYKQRTKQLNKKWMLEEMIFKTTSANIPITISYMLNTRFYENYIENTFGAFAFSVLFVTAFLISYITLQVIPEKGESLLEKTYPEYKIS